jgi:hypothetical protein
MCCAAHPFQCASHASTAQQSTKPTRASSSCQLAHDPADTTNELQASASKGGRRSGEPNGRRLWLWQGCGDCPGRAAPTNIGVSPARDPTCMNLASRCRLCRLMGPGGRTANSVAGVGAAGAPAAGADVEDMGCTALIAWEVLFALAG